MHISGKIVAIINGLGLAALIVGSWLINTRYDFWGIILAVVGGLVLLVGLVMLFIINLINKKKGPKIKYGRLDNQGS